MGLHTKIQWADSSLNIEAGCDGCELWNPRTNVRKCYAGTLTQRHKGKNGWPDEFEIPKIFPHRIDQAEKWSDLTGKKRENKPWLNGFPRIVFHNDMGDMFTESLPEDWFDPYLPRLSSWKHINILLTKRPARMAKYFKTRKVPGNFWLCTSVTNQVSTKRIEQLTEIDAPVLGLSIEPLWEDLDFTKVKGIDRISWVKIGGESGSNAADCYVEWIENCRDFFLNQGTAVFVKQLGAKVFQGNNRINLKDHHGGDWDEWPQDLKVRQMPKLGEIK